MEEQDELFRNLTEQAKTLKLKTHLCAISAFHPFKRLNYILFTAWDPLRLRQAGLWDEYIGYVPEILELKAAGANREEIAELLLYFQTTFMSTPGTMERCRKVADKILSL